MVVTRLCKRWRGARPADYKDCRKAVLRAIEQMKMRLVRSHAGGRRPSTIRPESSSSMEKGAWDRDSAESRFAHGPRELQIQGCAERKWLFFWKPNPGARYAATGTTRWYRGPDARFTAPGEDRCCTLSAPMHLKSTKKKRHVRKEEGCRLISFASPGDGDVLWTSGKSQQEPLLKALTFQRRHHPMRLPCALTRQGPEECPPSSADGPSRDAGLMIS